MDFLDKASKFLSDGLGILITKHPLRTSMGALFGVILIVINKVATNLLDESKSNPFHNIEEWYFIFVGIFVLHIPTFKKLLKNAPEFDEEIESALKAIDEAKMRGMPKYQVNQAYRKLCETILDNVKRS